MTERPTGADRAKAKELALLCRSGVGGTELRELAIAEALAAAREEGRDSVGLGDFMPDPCEEELRAPSEHIRAYYGTWLECSKRNGHEGGHEHETSGLTWSAS